MTLNVAVITLQMSQLQCYERRCYNATNMGVTMLRTLVFNMILEVGPNNPNSFFSFKNQGFCGISDYPDFSTVPFFQISLFFGIFGHPQFFKCPVFF